MLLCEHHLCIAPEEATTCIYKLAPSCRMYEKNDVKNKIVLFGANAATRSNGNGATMSNAFHENRKVGYKIYCTYHIRIN